MRAHVIFGPLFCLWGVLSLLAPPVLDAEQPPLAGLSGPGLSTHWTVWAGGEGDGRKVVADLRFDSERGYGHVGGEVGRLEGVTPVGGDGSWPAVWRDGIERYAWRVPRGRYAVELRVVETDVAAAGRRVFDVLGENELLFEGVDIAAEVGDFTWLVLRNRVAVYDGWLDLRFRSRIGSLPPRISGLRIARLEDAPAESALPPAPRVTLIPMPNAIGLRWELPAGAERWAQYGIFRASAPDGPFEQIGGRRRSVPWWIDPALAPDRDYWYRVCLYDLEGRRGPFSEVVTSRALVPEGLGLPVYRLELEEAALARLLGGDRAEVEARLSDDNERDYVRLRVDAEQGVSRKKSFFVTLDRERNRFFQDRRYLYLSADIADPTLLERLVWTRAAEEAELATPRVRPLILLINEAYAGLYFDVELVDRRFLGRSRLDRSGLLARFEGGATSSTAQPFDSAAPRWQVLGRKVTKSGSAHSLNRFRQEFTRVSSAQFESFVHSSLYIERFLKRRALLALRGGQSLFEQRLHALRDARNGQWEFFQQHLATVSHEASTPAVARAWLLGNRSVGALIEDRGWSLLERRLLGRPSHRSRYLELVESLIESHEEGFEQWVDDAFSRVHAAARADPLLWLTARHLEAFERGPAALKSAHESRLALLRGVRDEEASALPSPLVLQRVVVVQQSEPGSSVEVRNRSASETVALADYRLIDALSGGTDVPLPAERSLAPGETIVLSGGRDFEFQLDLTGGALALVGPSPRDRDEEVVLDTCFYGHPTAGFSQARGTDNAWGLLREATPGAQARPVAGLPYGFRQGLVEAPSGDLTIWVRPNWRQGPLGEASSTKIVLKHRAAGREPFSEAPLMWNDKLFRHEVTLPATAAQERTEYFFVATNSAGLEQVYPLVAPRLNLAIAPSPRVFINEVLPRPGLAEGSPQEFIELYNGGSAPVSLGGMYLSDSRRQTTKWKIPQGVVLPPGGFTVFYATNQSSGMHTNFRLNNSGEFVGLFGRIEEGNRLIDRVSFRALLSGQSWGRSKDGNKSFRMWKDPTPGARNMPKIPDEFLKKE